MRPLLPPFSAAKDVVSQPLLRGILSRWIWRLYTQRLTRAGRWFVWPTLAFMAYGGISLQLQGYIPFCCALGLWAVAMALAPVFRPRVRINVNHATRICAGQTLPARIEIRQTGRLGGMELTVLPHRLPPEIDAVPEDGSPVPRLTRNQSQTVQVGLRCTQRGVYQLPAWRVESDFPLGLLRSRRIFANPQTITVYPNFTRLNRLQLPTGRRYHPGGVAMASNLGESFEFIGNREYREGDNVRDIDWRATARLNRPIVREYRDEYFMRVAVILDTHLPPHADPLHRKAFEQAVSVAAAVSDHLARQDYLVDLLAAGPDLYHLTAGRSLAYLDQILDILACVQPGSAEPFHVIEPQIMENLSKITTVICVMLDWNEARRSFTHRLAAQGAAVKLIVVRDEQCTLDPTAEADTLGLPPTVTRQWFEAGIEEL